MFCPNCGSEINEDDQFCQKCGTKLGTGGVNVPLSSERVADSTEGKKPSIVLIVVGYIFALLGGLIGILIGAYLLSRNNSSAKFHGRNILIIAVVIMILGLVLDLWI